MPPDIFHRKFLLIGKKRLGKGGNGEEKKENCKGRRRAENLFALSSLFETTETCLGSTGEKKYFAPGKNREK